MVKAIMVAIIGIGVLMGSNYTTKMAMDSAGCGYDESSTQVAMDSAGC